jgi:uncharacterized protein (TIGR03083 family)
MDSQRHLEILATEGDRLASVPVELLDAPVPTVPGWTVEDVVRHTGKVHQWAAGVSRLPLDGDMASVRYEGIPKGPDCLPAYREALTGVIGALTDRPADTEVVTFLGRAPLGWWIRRQAHEVAVHRFDAEAGVAAAGGAAPNSFDVDAAADGLDEWAATFLAVRWGQRFGDFPADLEGATIHLHGTDPEPPADGSEWLISVVDGSVRVEATHAKGDVALRGSAEDLLLVMWRRRPLEVLEVLGDRSIAERLLEVATF